MIGLVLVAIILLASSGYLYYQYYGQPRCPACGMVVTKEMIDHIKVYDSQGNLIPVCCIGCAFRLLAAPQWKTLHIETYCDWYGPDYKITIDIVDGKVVKVEPETARFIIGAAITKSCASNRVAYNQTAVENLLKYGYSEYSLYKTELPPNAPVLTAEMAAAKLPQVGIKYAPPSVAFLAGIAVAGIVVLALSVVAWKKLAA